MRLLASLALAATATIGVASAAPHHGHHPNTRLRKARDGADAAAAGANDGGDMVKKALDDAPKQWWGNGNGGGNAPPALNVTWPVPQYRGVNLGGWLVLESWMYPEWWRTTGVPFWKGEHQFVETLGKAKARALLEKHWDTWVTKEDLTTLKNAGITHLRIPVGYWILGEEWLTEGEAYLPGGWKYLERCLGWCKELGLKTIIDLHGAPGVQNGNDNCGFSGGHDAIHWHEPKYLQKTTDVLVALARNLTATNATEAYAGTVEGLCLINEPWTTVVGGPIKLETVKDWTKSAVDSLLASGWKGSMWFPDGFQVTWEGWQGFLQPPQYHNVYADSHLYLLFDPALAQEGPEGLTNYVCKGWFREQLEKAKGRVASGVVVGEYSLDFKSYPSLTGQLTGEQLVGLQQLLLAEQRQFGVVGPNPSGNAAVGGFFWAFKSFGTVGNAEGQTTHSPWNYLALIKDGIASSDLATASFDCAAFAAGHGSGRPVVQGTQGVGTAGGPGNGR